MSRTRIGPCSAKVARSNSNSRQSYKTTEERGSHTLSGEIIPIRSSDRIALAAAPRILRIKNHKSWFSRRSRVVEHSCARNVNSTAPIFGEGALLGHSKHIRGWDESRWIRNVLQFERIRYEEIYRGTDLIFHTPWLGEQLRANTRQNGGFIWPAPE